MSYREIPQISPIKRFTGNGAADDYLDVKYKSKTKSFLEQNNKVSGRRRIILHQENLSPYRLFG